MGGWTLADLRALENDELATLISMINKKHIRPPGAF